MDCFTSKTGTTGHPGHAHFPWKGIEHPTTTIAVFKGVTSVVFFTEFSQIKPVSADLNNDKYCNFLSLGTDSLFRDVDCAKQFGTLESRQFSWNSRI